LAEDIGALLGCGGHVERLRRTAVGNFSIAQAVGFEQLEALPDGARLARLLPLERIVAELPAVTLGEEPAFFLRRGQPVWVPKAPTQGLLRLYSGQDAFFGIGEVLDDGRIAPRRLVREVDASQ
jgi:tRNA pseudouridine55 synthase